MGTIVLRDESPYGSLLGGMGIGMHRLAQQLMEDESRANELGRMILVKATTGELDPRYLATPEAEAMLREHGLDRNPQIAQLVEQGRSMLPATPGLPEQVEMGSAVGPDMNPEMVGPPAPGAKARTPDVRSAGGALVNMPKPEAGTPPYRLGAKDVTDIVAGEQARRSMGVEQLKARIELQKQEQLELFKDTLQTQRFKTFDEAKAVGDAAMRALGPDAEITYEYGKDGVSIKIKTPDIAQRLSRASEGRQQLNNYVAQKNAGNTHRDQALNAAKRILMGEGDMVKTMIDNNMLDPVLAAALSAAMAGADTKKPPLLRWKESAKLSLDSANRLIKNYNDGLKYYGKQFGYDDKAIAQDLVPEVTFEDIAGVSEAEWDKKSAQAGKGVTPDKAEELAAAASGGQPRQEPPPASKQPGMANPNKDARIKELRDGIATRIASAVIKNPVIGLDAAMGAALAPNIIQALKDQEGFSDKEIDFLKVAIKREAQDRLKRANKQ